MSLGINAFLRSVYNIYLSYESLYILLRYSHLQLNTKNYYIPISTQFK